MNKGILFFHTGDVHLDSPFRGIRAKNNVFAEKLISAAYQSFEMIVNACINEKADFLIISGDLFDSEKKSLKTIFFLHKQFDRLYYNGVKVVAIAGNHDPYMFWPEELVNHQVIHLFKPGKVSGITINSRENHNVYFAGYSYETSSLRESIHNDYKTSEKADFNIALLHGSIGEDSSIHHVYAPFKLDELQNKNFDYWALGHIHKPEILSDRIAYPGIPQPRHYKELHGGKCLKVKISSEMNPELSYVDVSKIEYRYLDLEVKNDDNLTTCFKKIGNLLKDSAIEKFYMNRLRVSGSCDSLFRYFSLENNKEEFLEQLNDSFDNQYFDGVISNIDQWISPEQFFSSNSFFKEIQKLMTQYPISEHINSGSIKNRDLSKINRDLINSVNDIEMESEIKKKMIDLFKSEFNEDL
ncbi:metallophosphoesterase family protein [Marinigracilibium pacificum]|uniref:DNA repair exonuclease n=1 Tax=Marinigracilibium pacificum TaxID=2729599 RepID=A0A848J3G0_9BACT|nr:DNA repair exonuclease [Marinigracilibium pacificum]NMM50045.1 DNA repair exonuclease [Marinigracilibium pacificum]